MNTTKQHLALTLARLLDHLDEQEVLYRTAAWEAGQSHRWGEAARFETHAQETGTVRHRLISLLTDGQDVGTPPGTNYLLYDLREAAGLRGNGEEWELEDVT